MILNLFRKNNEFYNIQGYDDIKDIVRRALDAEDNYNLLFIGPPASAKTQFLQGILDIRKDNGLDPMKFEKWSGSLVNSSDTLLGLPISGSGTLTAHFIEILPHDIINGVIVAGFVALGGLSLRAFSIRRREKLRERWLEIINSEYNRLSNNREECLHRLAEIREDVMHMYVDGTIPKHYFEKLNKQISTYEEGSFRRTPI
jgi:hypothetical protein